MERDLDRATIMNKLIQSITISAVVIAPLSSLALIADATMHHTPSHVSTVSLETTRTRTKKKKIRNTANIKAKKQVIKPDRKKAVSVKAKSSAPTMTPAPREFSQPKNPQAPQTIPVPPTVPTPSTSPQSSAPTPLLNSIDPKLGNPMMNQSRDIVLPNPADGTPTIPVSSPGSIANPSGAMSIPNPQLPTFLPNGLVK
jgi:hypothetical protein